MVIVQCLSPGFVKWRCLISRNWWGESSRVCWCPFLCGTGMTHPLIYHYSSSNPNLIVWVGNWNRNRLPTNSLQPNWWARILWFIYNFFHSPLSSSKVFQWNCIEISHRIQDLTWGNAFLKWVCHVDTKLCMFPSDRIVYVHSAVYIFLGMLMVCAKHELHDI